MNIYLVENVQLTVPLYTLLGNISTKLRQAIFNKFASYQSYGDVYHCKHLKMLNAKIWKYKGAIFKLRVDSGKESVRVLFIKHNNDLLILHAFLKSTQKTPKKEAHQAIAVLQQINTIDRVIWSLSAN
ncbi:MULTISPECIES: type II toxin-antitoxin system RelE/ParE family toxin [unclassified Photobacterium]|uniref:type II toxin-antitoxin system RelE/ParE family toxin n=1 Tax=unclassified Photobacterium TaxID=2628852 RepID=UPI001EDDF6B7|nr:MULTISPECIES: type II toxin-antitoxin system RelE/ParE family toxin [unclassified Photobacterium]MCG3866100.1 type II toxin-antitoxin system RelE/ParE family toxin [Photobacterium sp. Ph6]MCG3877607.1 type II toxin-antitoxin system RelE/ParE family toxin [Photobacterium sp. Ph5]